MNFLAHAYLSFGNAALLTGNMIGDFVKGNQLNAYPKDVMKGIRLHRAIDSFTDQHEVTKSMARLFKDDYRHYCHVFPDIIYDHFLANDQQLFRETPLKTFSQNCYQQLESYYELFPEAFRQVYYYMHRHDWLSGYKSKTGTLRAFEGVVRRARYINDFRPAAMIFEKNYSELAEHYQLFFPDLIIFVKMYCKTE